MHILIAPDSFKESLTATKVAQAIATGLQLEWPDAHYTLLPLADGGEGTVDILVSTLDGHYIPVKVHDPLMRPIFARYGTINDGQTAIIEVASASGLALVDPEDRNALTATSFGTGELIRHALDHGIHDFIIGLGGSATTDGGAGIAQALGFTLHDEGEDPSDLADAIGQEINVGEVAGHTSETIEAIKKDLKLGGAALVNIARIDDTFVHPGLAQSRFQIACDVSNPLCGPNGAAAVYGPQKGATPEQVEVLSNALLNYAMLLGFSLSLERELEIHAEGLLPTSDFAYLPGGGAAGGIAAGLLALTPATLKPGFELVAEVCNLESAIESADLIITGEGKIDAQTEQGKVPSGVAQLAQKYNKPTIAFCGTADKNDHPLFQKILSIDSIATSRQDAMLNATEHLSTLAESFAKHWQEC